MNRSNKLKFQLFASILSATLVIVFSTAFFFNELTRFLSKNEEIMSNMQFQFTYSNNLGDELLKIIQYKTDYSIREEDAHTTEEETVSKDVQLILKSIQIFVNESHNNPLALSFDKVDNLAKHITDISKFDNSIKGMPKSEIVLKVISEQSDVKEVLANFTNDLITYRSLQLQQNKKQLFLIEKITLGLIAIALGIFVFTFFKIYQTLQYVRKSSRQLRKVNSDLAKVSLKVEDTNWALQSSTSLTDKMSGIDDDKTISEIVLSYFNQIMPLMACAIYIRNKETLKFELRTYTGIKSDQLIKNFSTNEGYLGKIIGDKEIQSLDLNKHRSLKIETSALEQVSGTVFICPLVHEGDTVGLIELVLKNENASIERYEVFLQRACRNIATVIKFGQSHILVEQLLAATQQQAEEMEAQQEELRITNEELIHKTNLLEASEEELRVQQEELTQTNSELNLKAAELENRNIDLNHAQAVVEQKILEVEQASRYKSEFMANMSHELRTPLNSILILAKLLNDNKQKNLTQEQVKFAHVIHSAGSDLLALINELLDLAKIEAGKIELSEDIIVLETFVRETEELFKELSKDKIITFKTTISPNLPKSIKSDEYRIQQVLKNFLSNAFKFTEKNGTVTLNLYESGNCINFEVKDTGKGISKEKQELIFEAFKQEDGSTSRKYGGTGLGLSISREIAILLEGRIELESELGKGSTFRLKIPLQSIANQINPKSTSTPILERKKESQHEEIRSLSAEETSPRKILIIEDDINFADILKGFAQSYNFEVQLAHDGALGIKMAQEFLPDAIILDVMLPISDGWEVLGALKDNKQTKHIPVHMMSAGYFDKKDFLEKGAIGFLHKPVTKDTIQQTFENIHLNLNKSVKKILLIEDQELQSDFIKNTFFERRINVIQAFTIESGLNKLKEENNIDCIILDIQLPDGNGLEFIEKIKEDPKSNNIPIIINTAAELSKEKHDKILSYANATILKTDKSHDRLIDEVNLFLNKINDTTYQPLKRLDKVSANKQNNNTLTGKTVLIADDDMRNVFALSTSLQAYDMHIEIANNGLEAIKIIEEKGEKIDIVLMDIMMPEMDGHEAIQYIRRKLKYKNLPILAVTAKAMKGDKEKSIQVGANDYVSKPIDIEKLTSLMQIWLS